MKIISVQDFNNEFLNKTGQVLLKHTIQIFKHTIDSDLGSLGSGVLFSFMNNYFILTASHNLINQGEFVGKEIKNYFIQVGNHLYYLQNEVILGVDEKTYNNNKLDFAIIKLKSQSVIEALLENKKFLRLEDINFFPEQRVTYKPNQQLSDYYVLFGFPATKTKHIAKSDVSTVFVKEYNIKAYCQLEFLKNNVPQKLFNEGFTNHLFFSQIKKGSDLYSYSRIIKPIQNGLSGCGLWEIYAELTDGIPKLKLAGIFTEFQMGFGVSLKLNVVINTIRQGFNLKKLPSFK